MKRKFSFNLAPVGSASQPTPAPSHAHGQAHGHGHARHSSHATITISDSSPYIDRRPLDPDTERELRIACKLVLHNCKPSDHGIDPPTAHRNAARLEPKVRMPTGAPVDLKTALQARGLQQTDLTRRPPADAQAQPPRAKTTPGQTTSHGWTSATTRGRPTCESTCTPTRLPPAACRPSLTRHRSSSQRRKSRTLDPAAAADAQAAEWMRQERHKQHSSNPHARPSTAGPSPSRSRSIRDNIREYVFPATSSRTLSRAPSHASLHTMHTNLSQDSAADPPLSASAQGWRSWVLPRRSSSRTNSRPGTSKGQGQGQPEDKEQAMKTNPVNLNRELPPLPSLDSWRDSVQPPPEKAKSPTSAHIASLMRPQEQRTREHNPAKNKSHSRTGSDTLPRPYTASLAAPSPTNVASASTSHLGYARQSSGSTSTPKSGDNSNFSRNMSVETPARSTFSNEVKVSRREEQKSRLKKVFSGWMTKKEKKEDWMQRIEKEGVKEGVMVPDGPAGAPIVRF